MDATQEMSEVYKLLGDKTRLTILALLKEQELCVCHLVDILEMSQPNISQHMRKLKSAGLVQETRKGQWIYYSLHVEDKPFVQLALEHVPSVKEKIEKYNNNCC